MANANRRSYDTAASQQVQSDIQSIVGLLESLIADRDRAVGQAMSDFQADGVSDEYAAVEKRWKSASDEVKSIIALVKNTLDLNDQAANATLTKAKGAVGRIG